MDILFVPHIHQPYMHTPVIATVIVVIGQEGRCTVWAISHSDHMPRCQLPAPAVLTITILLNSLYVLHDVIYMLLLV